MARNFSEKAQVWIYHRPAPGGLLQVLLLLTHPRGEHGAFWQPVTGSVDEGETTQTGAAREAREETGLANTENVRALGYEFSFDGRGGKPQHEVVYSLETGGAQPPQIQIDPKEHSRYEWVKPEEALSRLKFESNQRALEILLTQFKTNQNEN